MRGVAFLLVVPALAAMLGGCRRIPSAPDAVVLRDVPPSPAKRAKRAGPPAVSLNALGTVFGRPIPRAFGQEARSFVEAAGLPNGIVLQVAAGLVLATDEARRLGFARRPGETQAAWAARFVRSLYDPARGCRNLPRKALREFYALHRNRFVHPDVFDLIDVQIACCPAGRAPCEGEPGAAACFERAMARAELIAARMGAQAIDADTAQATAQAIAREEEGVKWRRYRAAYDYDAPPDAQPGRWVVLDPNLLAALRDQPAGSVVGPVRSAYGAHVLFVVAHEPPATGDFDDPDVQRALRRAVCAERVATERVEYLRSLAATAPVVPKRSWRPETSAPKR